MKQRFNTEHIVDIHKYHTQLAHEIDEAEWLGDAEDEAFLDDVCDRLADMHDSDTTYLQGY